MRRLRRRGQAGFTLIEAVVTVGIVSASVVTLVGAMADAEKSAGMETQQAHVQVALSSLGDDLRSSVINYSRCTTNGVSYRNALRSIAPVGVTVNSVAVARPAAGTALTPRGCSFGSDYGLQRLTLTVSTGGTSASRVVWKSEATTAPAPPPGRGGGGGG